MTSSSSSSSSDGSRRGTKNVGYHQTGNSTFANRAFQGGMSNTGANVYGNSLSPRNIQSYRHSVIGTPLLQQSVGASYAGVSPPSSSLTPGAPYRTASIQGDRKVSTFTATGQEILSERVVEHEVKVPKRIVREEIVEKITVVPEKIVHEEVIEETQKVREKIVEVAKPVYQEKIVEVPEIEYVEKIVEVPEKIVQEKVREVPRVEIQERIIEVPKIITQEKVVEVPEIEYCEVPIEKIVEVPEVHQQTVIKEVPIPQYVDKPIPEHITVEVPHKVPRNIPVPVEAITTFEYRLPNIRPHYSKATFPVYVPRFVEVPVPEELLVGQIGHQASYLSQGVSMLTSQAAPSLCEIENIAADVKKLQLPQHIASSDYHAALLTAWNQGQLLVTPAQHTTSMPHSYMDITPHSAALDMSRETFRSSRHVSASKGRQSSYQKKSKHSSKKHSSSKHSISR